MNNEKQPIKGNAPIGDVTSPAEQKPKKKEELPFEAPHVNRTFAITVISIFVAMLLLPTVAWGVLKAINVVNPSIMETIDFDTGENRAFAEFPKTFDPQTVTSEIESWYNDHLPFRSVLYKTQKNMETALEAPFDETLRPALIKLFHGSGGEGSTPGGDVIEDPFGNESETTLTSETETIPEFETIEDEPSSCTHQYANASVVVQEPTCTEWGVEGYTCELCGIVGNKHYTPKKAHDYVSSLTEKPICGTKYEETLTCSACGDSNTKTAVKQHTPGKKLAVNEPSYLDYGYTLIECKDCRTQYRTQLSNKLYDTSYFPPLYKGTKVYEGRSQWLFYRPENSEAYFMGTNLASDAELESYASTFQQLNNLCKAKGIQLQICVWPNKEQVYPEYTPTMNIATEYKRVERIVDYVTENTDVNMIYPLTELTQAKPYWELYWPLDTHWNNAGAFIGYQAMLKALGLETSNLTTLPIDIINGSNQDKYVKDRSTSLLYGVKGDLCSIGGVSSWDYPVQKNYIIKYLPDVVVDSKDGVDLGDKDGNLEGMSDTRITTASNAPNDLNFVMLADSYRIMQLTYLERDFTNCFLTHRDNRAMPDVIEAVKNADILVIAAVERAETDILNTAKTLIKILSSAD